MNNMEKQQFFIELNNSIDELIIVHNNKKDYTIVSSEISLLVNSIINDITSKNILTYKERIRLYEEMFDKAVNILVFAGFEFKK